MIDFKHPEMRLPSALIAFSLLILLGTLIYMVAVPAPSATVSARGREMSRRKIQDEIETAKKRAQQLQAEARPRLWQGDSDAVAAAALDTLTNQARQRGLKLAAFRPQRPQALEGLTELPFSVQVSGPFPAVQATLSALGSQNSRLALRSVQIAASDAETGAVTATLGLSAYVPAANAPVNSGGRTGSGSSSRDRTSGERPENG